MDDEIDDKYEFNAPKYIDFTQGDIDVDTDKWFDERPGDEGGIDIDMVPFYEKDVHNIGYDKATTAISAALKSGLNEAKNMHTETNGNVYDSLPHGGQFKADSVQIGLQLTGAGAEANYSSSTEQAEALPLKIEENGNATVVMECLCNVSQNENVDSSNSDETQSGTDTHSNNQVGNQGSGTEGEQEPQDLKEIKPAPRRSLRPANLRTSWDSPKAHFRRPDGKAAAQSPSGNRLQQVGKVQKSSVSDLIGVSDLKRKGGASAEAPVPKRAKQLVIPETPAFVRRWKDKTCMKKGETTEAMELRMIKDLQKETKERMKQSSVSRQHSLKAHPYRPVRSVHPVTQPAEFHFATDQRIKDHPMQTRADAAKPFESQLRNHPPSPPMKRETTKPKPFNLSGEKQADSRATSSKWESLASMSIKFQSKTPERFRTKPRVSSTEPAEQLPVIPKLTHPRTPLLTTKARARPVTAPSRQDTEEQEIQEMKNYQFKAAEFDPRIVERRGMFGVKKQKEIQVTDPKPFHFQSDDRLQMRKQKEEHASQESGKVPRVASDSTCTNSGISSDPSENALSLKPTEPKPFSFEARDKERLAKKEMKIQKAIEDEEKLRQFHARPLPTSSPDHLPDVPAKKATNPEPFALSDGGVYLQKRQQQLQEELEDEKQQRQFRAQPAEVLKKDPFRPKPGLKPPTDITAFSLNTDSRAQEREKFDEWKAEQERVREEARFMQKEQKQKENEERLLELRDETVVRAKPVRKFKPVEVLPSSKPLTVAQTPQFATNKRISRL